MSITINPVTPADADSPTQGAANIRAVTAELQEMFGGAGTAPVTYAVAPFTVDTTTGLSTVPGVPTVALGIATKSYVDSTSPTYTGTATGTNTYAVTLAPVPANLAALQGVPIFVFFTNANTTAATLNANTFGGIAIKKSGGAALTGGELKASQWTLLIYDGTNFELVAPTPSPVTAVYKLVDQTVTNSVALVDDTELKFTVGANDVWAFTLDVYSTFDGGAVGGWKGAFTVPAGATLQWTFGSGGIPVTASGTTNPIAAGGGFTTSNMVELYGQVIVAGTAGTVQLRWAQNTANAVGTILKTGSSLIATKLN